MNEQNSYATHFGHTQQQQRSISPSLTPSPNHSPSQTPSSTSPGLYTGPHGVPQGYPNGMQRYPLYLQGGKQAIPSHLSTLHGQVPGQSNLNQQASNQGNAGQALSNHGPVTATSKHHQEQLNLAAQSRNASGPHYHARAAAIHARQNSNAITITDPNSRPGTTTTTGNEKFDGPSQQWATLDLGGMGLKNISNELFQYTFLSTLYINHNNLSHLSPEFARLRNLTILDASGNKLSSIPSELGMLTKLKELLLVDNSIVNIPTQLGTLYRLDRLGLEGNPLNDVFKSLLHKEGTQGLIGYLKEHLQAPPTPPEREWISLDKEMNSNSNESFTVLDYNILAEKYATTQMYGYTPTYSLAWPYRRENLFTEIQSYHADIVCLQEVEASQYEEFFKDQLLECGDYESVFWPKSRAKTMGEWERKSVDGCATFFKNTKFKLIESQLVEFNQIALQREDFRKTEEVYNRVMTKDNIAVLTLLENKENGSRVLIANAHIHWDPTYKDVKLVQVAMLMEEIEKWVGQYIKIPPTKSHARSPSGSIGPPTSYSSASKLPTIICGDFNSVPSSGVCEFLSRGSMKQNHDDFGQFAYGNYTSEGLSHGLALKSAYAPGYELPFTNYTPSFSDVIDYIWYTANTLTVTGLLGPIDKEYISQVVGFPNPHFPSDHVAILAEFRVKPAAPLGGTVVHNQSSSRRQPQFNK